MMWIYEEALQLSMVPQILDTNSRKKNKGI